MRLGDGIAPGVMEDLEEFFNNLIDESRELNLEPQNTDLETITQLYNKPINDKIYEKLATEHKNILPINPNNSSDMSENVENYFSKSRKARDLEDASNNSILSAAESSLFGVKNLEILKEKEGVVVDDDFLNRETNATTGCSRIDVRLGIWVSRHLGFWASGLLGILASGLLGIWASGHLGS